MSGPESVITNPTVLAAIAVAYVGFVAFWANPQRAMNRAFFTGSLHVAIWLIILHLALTSTGGLFWLKWSCAIGGCLPMHIWIIQQNIVDRRMGTLLGWARGNWGWLLVSGFLLIIPFTEYFIPSHSTADHRLRGWGYYGYVGLSIGAYGYLFRDAYRSFRNLAGVRRLELQVWLIGGCTIAVTVLVLMALTDVTRDPIFIRIQPWIVLLFYAGTAYAITTHRILDARQILLFGAQKLILVIAIAAVAYFLDWGLRTVLPEPFGFLATTALALWLAVTLNGWLDRWFHFYPQATAARQAAFAAAQRETHGDKLELAFVEVLKGWGHSEHALVVSGGKGMLTGGGIELPDDGTVVRAMQQLRWITPERLTRERSTPDRAALQQFLTDNGLGVMVFIAGPSLTALIGVGVAASRRPITYPQVTQLQELASIIENAIERTHFSVKAQRAEQLATVGLLGASLAHEIRNPLVSIKAFVQLLPQHYQDPVFREKFFHLIGDEVMRIDRLTEQLLDLASPRVYSAQVIDLNAILHSTLELVAAKAADKHIQFLTDFQASPDQIYTDASAAKQVLINLCFNAIQALEARPGERWVKLSTHNLKNRVEVVVEDSGPGISPEIRPRLFQPFQSTKSSGFGLGLAVCSDILTGLDATITVDANEPGRGATFRIVFPCQA
ncbi:MAG: ATP-binding protein [Opitutaceae bacterium]